MLLKTAASSSVCHTKYHTLDILEEKKTLLTQNRNIPLRYRPPVISLVETLVRGKTKKKKKHNWRDKYEMMKRTKVFVDCVWRSTLS